MSEPIQVISRGDEIWMFVELIRQLAHLPALRRVRVTDIRREAHGTKTLVLEVVEADERTL
jgi:hypothetical protein